MNISRVRYFIAFVFVSLIVMCRAVYATPSTTYWTPATVDIQPFGVLHVGVDNYFTVFRKSTNGAGAFPTDAGLTMGVLPFEKIQMEVGVDLLEPSDYPVYFNAKIGTPQDAFFKYSPAVTAGVFNVGLHTRNTTDDPDTNNRTDYNIGYGLIGEAIPYLGRIHGGYYYGNPDALVTGNNHRANHGFMVAFDHGFFPVKDASGGEYNRVVLAADYASGKNYIGGGGFGIYYFFSKDISLLVGPVWFNDEKINGKWKITVQLDINVDLFGKKEAEL